MRSGILAAMAVLALLAAAPARADNRQRDAIREEIAALVGPPSGTELVVERGLAAQAALLRNDPAEAARIAASVLAESRMQPWRYAPLTDFMAAAVLPDSDAFRAGLEALLAADPRNAFALNLRALYFLETAWARRSNAFAKSVRPDQWAGFRDNMGRAATAIEAALRVRDDIPYSQHLRLRILAGEGNTPKLEAAFQEAIARFPNYYPLYDWRLRMLSPRWGGSPKAMADFVQTHTARTPAGSPLRMLNIMLYQKLIDEAALRCQHLNKKPEARAQCVDIAMQETTPPELEERIIATLRQHKAVDALAFSRQLGIYLSDMVRTGGAEAHAGAFLELASEFLGSDNRQMRPAGVKGNHVLDLAAADIWRYAGNAESAMVKYQHALDDVAATDFPDPDSRAAALAGIYDRMADLARWQQNHAKTAIYIEAAIAIGGDVPERRRHLACRAYLELKLFADGIRLCTRLPGGINDTPTLYWRAMNEQAAGDVDTAIARFRRLAATPDEYGTSSAIRISVLLAKRNDLHGMLAVLNGHPYLFNERTQGKENLATAYNNRCYALMELGEHEKALRDCTISLKYWNIPDAYTKQQKLVRLLRVKQLPPT